MNIAGEPEFTSVNCPFPPIYDLYRELFDSSFMATSFELCLS